MLFIFFFFSSSEVEKKNEEFIIPMLGSSSVTNRILDRLNERESSKKEIKQDKLLNGDGVTIQIKKEPGSEELPITLEEQAAQEIIRDLQKNVKVEDEQVNMTIVQTNNAVETKEVSFNELLKLEKSLIKQFNK